MLICCFDERDERRSCFSPLIPSLIKYIYITAQATHHQGHDHAPNEQIVPVPACICICISFLLCCSLLSSLNSSSVSVHNTHIYTYTYTTHRPMPETKTPCAVSRKGIFRWIYWYRLWTGTYMLTWWERLVFGKCDPWRLCVGEGNMREW